MPPDYPDKFIILVVLIKRLMKTLYFLFFLMLPVLGFGKIWIVDSNAGSSAKDFTNLQSAHDGAIAGDTLYLVGSPVNYITTKVTLTKKLIIIGPGYFLGENPDTQTNVASAFLNNTAGGVCEELEFAAGSEGSVLMGIEIIGRLVINTNNILIKRNHIRQEGACNLTMATINGSNILFVQNFVDGNLNSPNPLIQVSAGKSGISVGNNYFFHSCSGCGGGVLALESPATSSIDVYNNIFYGGISVVNSTVQNNLFRTGNTLSFTSSLVRNNLAAAAAFLPAGNGNISNITGFLNAFLGSGSTDGQWKLSSSSPAIGAGFNGVDCGIFGGPEPYVLSGIPPIPTIYSLTAPAVGEKNTGLPIQIKVKSNN